MTRSANSSPIDKKSMKGEQEYTIYVGIDWGSTAHQQCVLGRDRRILREGAVKHTPQSIATMAEQLLKYAGGVAEQVAVGIETCRGPVVESLSERGFSVYAINPKQLDRLRDRHTVAGAKDDRRDAFVLADALWTDQRLFRRVRPEERSIVMLRNLSRTEQTLTASCTRLTNQLLAQLYRYYPQMLELCPSANARWIWQLLASAPTPDLGAKLAVDEVAPIVRQYHLRRWTAESIVATLRAPGFAVAPGVVEGASQHVALLVAQLMLLDTQRKAIAKSIANLLRHKSGENVYMVAVQCLLSMPGIGDTVAAVLIAEAWDLLKEQDCPTLRAQSGLAPVTRRSGKSWRVFMRYGCNQRLRWAVFHWARTAIHIDPYAKAHYQALRQRGHSFGRALRGVADRLLSVLMAMLRDRTLYDSVQRLGSTSTNSKKS